MVSTNDKFSKTLQLEKSSILVKRHHFNNDYYCDNTVRSIMEYM